MLLYRLQHLFLIFSVIFVYAQGFTPKTQYYVMETIIKVIFSSVKNYW